MKISKIDDLNTQYTNFGTAQDALFSAKRLLEECNTAYLRTEYTEKSGVEKMLADTAFWEEMKHYIEKSFSIFSHPFLKK